MDSPYIDWLRRQGIPLLEGAGMLWRTYEGALVPACSAPTFARVDPPAARSLLRQSRAWLMRYSSDPSEQPTEWWYVVCDKYDPRTLSSGMRNKINRGRSRCTVVRVTADWLAMNGYSCYLSAFGRYEDAARLEEIPWREHTLKSDHPSFEHWGVFVGSHLAGYTICILEGENVASRTMKLDPAYLKERSAYALVSSLLTHYVAEGGKTMSNGNRAVSHETQFQEFLMSHGFRRQFCRLNVAYRPALRVAIDVLYPFRGALGRWSRGKTAPRVQALLTQERWRRSFGDARRG
jgi:hypothetical protein